MLARYNKIMKDSILFIDKEQDNLYSFQLAFWSKFNLLLAKDFHEAETILANYSIKLVITEQNMPNETGLDFIRRIKPQYPDIIFMVLRPNNERELVLDAVSAGIYQFINKPWVKNEMMQLISNAIINFELKKQNRILLGELGERV